MNDAYWDMVSELPPELLNEKDYLEMCIAEEEKDQYDRDHENDPLCPFCGIRLEMICPHCNWRIFQQFEDLTQDEKDLLARTLECTPPNEKKIRGIK